MTMDTPTTDEAECADSVVARSAMWWHVAFYLCYAGTATFFVLAVPWPERLGALVPLGLIVLSHTVFALPDWPSPNRGQAHVVIMIVCFVAAACITPYSGFLYFFATGQIWMFSKGLREVVAGFAALAVGLTGAIVVRTGTLPLEAFVLQVLLPCVACFGMGYWIHGIIVQSEERADLLRALREAQDELARAHHVAGAAAERERVARDIHDTLAQGFTSVVLLSEAAIGKAERGASVAAELESIREIGKDNLVEARALVRSGQQSWDDSTFLGALRRTCAKQEGVTVDVDIEEFRTGMIANEKIMVLRGLQEALANVTKHARARTVSVSFRRRKAGVVLEVADDGVGFASESVPEYSDGRERFGLFSMGQRAAEVGADLVIDSAPSRGTRVVISVPVDRTDEAMGDHHG